jgi:hypothetical protein
MKPFRVGIKNDIRMVKLEKIREKVRRHTFYYDFKNQYEIDVADKKAPKNFCEKFTDIHILI